jgi:hypothetical protein
MNIYNLILYIGLALMALGLVSFMISCIMERHYETKLFELNEKLRKDDKWRKKWTE